MNKKGAFPILALMPLALPLVFLVLIVLVLTGGVVTGSKLTELFNSPKALIFLGVFIVVVFWLSGGQRR